MSSTGIFIGGQKACSVEYSRSSFIVKSTSVNGLKKARDLLTTSKVLARLSRRADGAPTEARHRPVLRPGRAR
jgi:hypothetical protein